MPADVAYATVLAKLSEWDWRPIPTSSPRGDAAVLAYCPKCQKDREGDRRLTVTSWSGGREARIDCASDCPMWKVLARLGLHDWRRRERH